jgi:tetratricopeptide (TPR) repeat protein/predicted transcriptional regulator
MAEGMPGTDDVVAVVKRRIDLLERLREPRQKREIVDALSVSRSTVDRAMRELEQYGFVCRLDGGFVATELGRTVAESYRRFQRRSADVFSAREALEPLPPDVSLGAAMLEGASVTLVEERRPFEPPPVVGETFADADEIRAVFGTSESPQLVRRYVDRAAGRDAALSVILDETLYETLRDQLSEALSGRPGCAPLWTADAPPYSLFLTAAETTTVTVVVYERPGVPHAVVQNDAAAAVSWATETVEELASTAERASATAPAGRPLDATAGGPGIESAGFVELTSAYFERREPAPIETCLRTGVDLAEVIAGYAVDREWPAGPDGETLTSGLVSGLRVGTDHALLGPPGSGKSTVCKTVAVRWYERELGPVLYREGESDRPFVSADAVADRLRDADGHALVVVEDAVRPGANAAFRLAQSFADRDDVTFLFDARADEWDDPPGGAPDAALETVRDGAVEAVTMPSLTATDVERLLERIEREADTRIEVDSASLASELAAAGASGPPEESAGDDGGEESAGGDAGPSELLLLLHRLARYADPLGEFEPSTPTTLAEDVERVYDDLGDTGPIGGEVGVLVNLLNAADIEVRPALVRSLALERGDTEDAVSDVDDALSVLSGRVLFDRPDGSYRTVHEAWSAQFLQHVLEDLGERRASTRLGWCVTAFLSLADEGERLQHSRLSEPDREPSLDSIAAAPTEWADATVAKLFGVGLERPGLAPLYGTSSYSPIRLPDACSPSMQIQCAAWRGRMYLSAGKLDTAARELRAALHLTEYPPDDADPERVTELSARCRNDLGSVANDRGDYERATKRYSEALDRYREIGARHGESRCLNNLGTLAYLAGDLVEAEEYFERSLDVDREIGARRTRADTLTNLGVLAKAKGDPGLAEERYEAALALYREVGDPKDRADVLVNLGSVALHRGDVAAAEEYSIRCLDVYRDVGHDGGTAHAFNHLGTAARLRGDLDEAATYLERSLDCYAEVDDERNAAEARAKLADVARLRGDLDEAEALAEASLSGAREAGDRQGAADALDRLAAVALARGDLVRAESLAEESLETDEVTGNVRGAAESSRLLGLHALERGSTATARDRLRTARSEFADVGDRFGAARSLRGLGECAAARGDVEAARSRFTAAAETFRELGGTRDAADALARGAAVARESGDESTASELYEEARALATAAGMDDRAAELDAALASVAADGDEAGDGGTEARGTSRGDDGERDSGDDGERDSGDDGERDSGDE